MHHPEYLYKEGSFCENETLGYSFRTLVQPGSHRLADFWRCASKSKREVPEGYSKFKSPKTRQVQERLVSTLEQYAPSFYRSRLKYVVWSWNTHHFHSYCSSRNVLFMGQSELDPWTIYLNLNVNLHIEIFYQYYYVAHIERLNYGTITVCHRKGSAYWCKIT